MSLFRMPDSRPPESAAAHPSGDRHRARFHTLTVSDVRHLTDDAIEVGFTVPAELADDYAYLPGQYVALRVHLDGAEVRRSYSLCRPPVPVLDGATRKTLSRSCASAAAIQSWP